ncbi:MAG: transposase [Gammaproteobacteria bacterium]|nr:transposase [Gammaproteobacteria bacterium]
MLRAKRGAFQAEMAAKYCDGSPRQAEVLFGWNRDAVALGLHEKRTGIVCLRARSAIAGDKLWEEKHPDVANAPWVLAQYLSQQDPTFRTVLSFPRLSAKEALKQLRAQGFADEVLPCPSTISHTNPPPAHTAPGWCG